MERDPMAPGRAIAWAYGCVAEEAERDAVLAEIAAAKETATDADRVAATVARRRARDLFQVAVLAVEAHSATAVSYGILTRLEEVAKHA